MKKIGLYAGFAGLVLVFLIYLAAGQGEASIPLAAVDLNGAQTSSDSMLFQKKEETGLFRLTYGWKGFYAVSYRADLIVLKSDLSNASREIGYNQKNLKNHVDEALVPLRREMIEHLYPLAAELIRKSAYSSLITLEKKGDMEFTLRFSSPPELYADVKAEFSRIMARIARKQNVFFARIEKKKKQVMTSFFKQRGLRLEGDSVSVDYSACVSRNAPRLKDMTRTLRDLNTQKSIAGFVSVLLSFIQQISYAVPPLKENDRDILGFWPPSRVLVENSGDCDSKSVLFASCWKNFRRYPLLLIKVPQHMFIGLAIPSLSDLGLEINGLRYTLCEVAGPDLYLPGLISPLSRMYMESGRYRYELVR